MTGYLSTLTVMGKDAVGVPRGPPPLSPTDALIHCRIGAHTEPEEIAHIGVHTVGGGQNPYVGKQGATTP